jgi:hypothetical protein
MRVATMRLSVGERWPCTSSTSPAAMLAKPLGKEMGSNTVHAPISTVCPRITKVWLPAAVVVVTVVVPVSVPVTVPVMVAVAVPVAVAIAVPLGMLTLSMLCTGPLSLLPKLMTLAVPDHHAQTQIVFAACAVFFFVFVLNLGLGVVKAYAVNDD